MARGTWMLIVVFQVLVHRRLRVPRAHADTGLQPNVGVLRIITILEGRGWRDTSSAGAGIRIQITGTEMSHHNLDSDNRDVELSFPSSTSGFVSQELIQVEEHCSVFIRHANAVHLYGSNHIYAP